MPHPARLAASDACVCVDARTGTPCADSVATPRAQEVDDTMEIFIVTTIVVVLVGISVLLVAAMLKSIRSEGGKVWKNYALSISFCILFFVSWIAQGIAEWGVYRDQQKEHHETPTISGFVVDFGQSTLENWQSEFLQLFSFVVLSALLIHKGSAESKDSDEEMQATLKRIEKRLDEMEKVGS
jgi:uncharacterized protein DUF6766